MNLLYIDPAATTALVSAITAIVLAIGASAIVVWRKIKKNVSKALKIDPNAGKEMEDELVITDEENAEKTANDDVKTEEEQTAETENNN